MFRLIYNLFMPVGFLFYVPGLYFKYRNRPGWKTTFNERFGCFSPERVRELEAFHGAVWIHAVSVGEAVVALSLLRAWREKHPERKFIISTTTTTGQELVRSQAPADTAVIFCPIDFLWMVRRTLKVLKPSMLVIFETEIWPNMVIETRRRGVPVALVNGRMSDHSVRGYRKARCFFGPLLRRFNLLSVQTEADMMYQMERDRVWGRATNAFDKSENRDWSRHGIDDPYQVLGENATRRKAEAPRHGVTRKLPATERKALEILDARDTWSRLEIRKQYKSLVKDLHPDLNGGNRADEERLQEVVWAWDQIKESRFFRD